MGLDTTHDCWHGAYSAFMRWRQELARVAGLPPLEFMDGFWGTGPLHNPFWHRDQNDNEGSIWSRMPIKWECLKPSPLYILLHHSDCEGELLWQDCGPIADELDKLIPLLPEGEAGGHIGNWRDKTATFVAGLRRAFTAQENVDFH